MKELKLPSPGFYSTQCWSSSTPNNQAHDISSYDYKGKNYLLIFLNSPLTDDRSALNFVNLTSDIIKENATTDLVLISTLPTSEISKISIKSKLELDYIRDLDEKIFYHFSSEALLKKTSEVVVFSINDSMEIIHRLDLKLTDNQKDQQNKIFDLTKALLQNKSVQNDLSGEIK